MIWEAGWEFIKDSPILGYGFHADRLILGTHIHNAVLHSLIQAGLVGTIAFIGAFSYAAFLLIRLGKNVNNLLPEQKQMVVQTAGVMVMIGVRSIWESSGSFFGIDLLVLGPLLLYLQVLASSISGEYRPAV